ncbi:MAG TPA: Fic/DOC family N-terminal domain-containing protein [Phycisphaerales bacterium]|nr:Fic/DOC family N-terminal domain-containing protein [Phycisphaerales bacterium]
MAITLRVVAGAKPLKVKAFVPRPLPPRLGDPLRFVGQVSGLLLEAQSGLDRLDLLCESLPSSGVLLRALRKREVQRSSEIENTFASIEEMSVLEAGRKVGRESVAEVLNNLAAVEHALASPLPLCNRLLCEAHARLLEGVRGDHLRPGKFRDGQVYIGNPARGVEAVRYVPPPPGEHLRACLDDFEKAMNPWAALGGAKGLAGEVPWLVWLGFLHYQFEAVHPFSDGNGRLGRLLVHVAPCKWGRLRHPITNVSEFFMDNRRAYYDALLAVSNDGDWLSWTRLFLSAVARQSVEDQKRVRAMVALRESYLRATERNRNRDSLARLVDLVFAQLVITNPMVAERLGVSKPTAQKLIDVLVGVGALEETTGETYAKLYRASAVLSVLDAPASSLVV